MWRTEPTILSSLCPSCPVFTGYAGTSWVPGSPCCGFLLIWIPVQPCNVYHCFCPELLEVVPIPSLLLVLGDLCTRVPGNQHQLYPTQCLPPRFQCLPHTSGAQALSPVLGDSRSPEGREVLAKGQPVHSPRLHANKATWPTLLK